MNFRSISEASAFVASLSQENPPKIPPRPHERPNKNTSNHNVSFEIHVSQGFYTSIQPLLENPREFIFKMFIFLEIKALGRRNL